MILYALNVKKKKNGLKLQYVIHADMMSHNLINMGRIYNKELQCGCLISSDGEGALIHCYSDNCKFTEWTKTEDYKKHLAEIERYN